MFLPMPHTTTKVGLLGRSRVYPIEMYPIGHLLLLPNTPLPISPHALKYLLLLVGPLLTTPTTTPEMGFLGYKRIMG